jgi:hypothetical protein
MVIEDNLCDRPRKINIFENVVPGLWVKSDNAVFQVI